MAISGYLFFRLCVLVQENGVSGIVTWTSEFKSHILNILYVRRQNSANGYHAQAQNNQSDTNDSAAVVHEPRSSVPDLKAEDD